MNYLISIVGPTAVGKTAFCIEVAKAFQTEIISADSRQFFKEMEIGTAKPTDQELASAKHHFINSHSIHELFNAGAYEKKALQLIEELFEKREFLILTGGSGLYVQAVTEGMSEMPVIDTDIRDGLNKKLREEGLAELLAELSEVDPEYFGVVEKTNPQRIVRALEVWHQTGKKYSDYRKTKASERPFKVIKIGLEREREELYVRINQRMDQMVEAGLFEEVESLIAHRNHNALQTVGYKEVFDFLDGIYDKEEAIRLLKRNSRRYAKRQMTWFRRDEGITWFHPNQTKEVIEYVKNFASKANI